VIQTLNLKKNLDLDHTLVLIGECTERASACIQCFDNYTSCAKYYGEDNTISKSYFIAQTMGVTDILTISYSNIEDISNIADVLQQYDFTYICLLDILASEYFNDPYKNNKRTFYAQYILEQMHNNNNSIVIATDKHASLYEDMDAFIDDMSFKLSEIKKSFIPGINLRNFIFVDNNLKDYEWANVILASMLCIVDIPEYPSYPNIGNAVFDIDACDIHDEQIYFKTNTLLPTTAENLLNISDTGITKVIVLDRIVKYIERSLDFSDFIGKLYSAYQRDAIKKRLKQYLDSWNGWLIYKYTIDSVETQGNPDGTMRIILRYTIWLRGTTESYGGEVVL
jgi:hypothetical protein